MIKSAITTVAPFLRTDFNLSLYLPEYLYKTTVKAIREIIKIMKIMRWKKIASKANKPRMAMVFRLEP